jgi:hypothetical protein
VDRIAVATGALRRLIELSDERSVLFHRFQCDLSAERRLRRGARQRVDADLEMMRLYEMEAQVIRNELERQLLAE